MACHCGSWVGRAARACPEWPSVITIGVCSHGHRRQAFTPQAATISTWSPTDRLELYAYRDPRRRRDRLAIGGARLADDRELWARAAFLGPAGLGASNTDAVYVTIDKDVLRADDAVTNWDQGQTSLDFVASAIRRVAGGRRIIGADVVGDWSAPIYGGDLAARALKRGEAFLDQPRRRPQPANARAVNEAANLRLLDLLCGAPS
jgi:hypothetical protein